MTTQPEIVGYLDERDLDVMPRDLAEHLQGEKNFPFKTPLVRLSDYEALQAECEKLREGLERIAAWPDGGNQYGQRNIKIFAAEAMAAYRKAKGVRL